MEYRLLAEFRRLFEGQAYHHRRSTQGDHVASQLYEDLVELGRSSKLVVAVHAHQRVLNAQNVRRGITARRGDGTFGEIIPHQDARAIPGHAVGRGPIATVEIGCEVKVLFKAMLKQIDRVINDLRGQVAHFQRGGGMPICVGIVGVNWAERCTSYEGDQRPYPTDGRKYKHPIQEAREAEERLRTYARPSFDEFLVLRFRAPNDPPFSFQWLDADGTAQDYGAALTRISREYDRRF
jgi:hypothetical protein